MPMSALILRTVSLCQSFFFVSEHAGESKITKILNSKENSKRKVPNQMAKSKIQTHQTNRTNVVLLRNRKEVTI